MYRAWAQRSIYFSEMLYRSGFPASFYALERLRNNGNMTIPLLAMPAKKHNL
jgi:hypothetical protein